MKRIAILVAAVWLPIFWAAGCGATCKVVKSTRCNRSVVELCGNNGKWQRVLDCSQIQSMNGSVGPQWVCAGVAGEYSCKQEVNSD